MIEKIIENNFNIKIIIIKIIIFLLYKNIIVLYYISFA